MKLPPIKKWLFSLALLIPCLLWLEHERNKRLLVGTWLIVEEGKIYRSSYPRLYQIFHGDGTGEAIFEWQSKRGTAPFIYKFAGLSRLEITQDYSFCGTDVVPLDDPCLRNIQPLSRIEVSNISLSFNGKIMYFRKFKPDNELEVYAQRVVLKPLQGRAD